MGQLTVPNTQTHTYGTTPITSPAVVRDTAATQITIHFENQDAAAQGFSVRLYWTATPVFDTLNQVGSQISGNHAYLAPVDVNFSLSGVGAGYLWGWWGMDSPGFTGTLTWWMLDDLVYCGYGTRLKPGTPFLVTMLPAVLTTVVAAVTDGWGWPVAALFLGQSLDVALLCSAPRPDAVDFTLQDLADATHVPPNPYTGPALAKAYQWLRWAAWPTFCECTPGSPSPHDPPVVIDHRPPGAQDGPGTTFLCDNNDLCTQLAQVILALSAIAANQQREAGVVNYIQRQGVPDTYAYGTSHAGLSGAGDFGVASILGLSITFTTLPSTYPSFGGDPDMYHQLGRISLGTADGWERSWWATHSPYLILPISAAVTKVGWTFPSGIVATITELVRTP